MIRVKLDSGYVEAKLRGSQGVYEPDQRWYLYAHYVALIDDVVARAMQSVCS